MTYQSCRKIDFWANIPVLMVLLYSDIAGLGADVDS